MQGSFKTGVLMLGGEIPRPASHQRQARSVPLTALAVPTVATKSATHTISSLMRLFSIRLADPRSDWDDPYALREYESVGAVAMPVFILFSVFVIFQRAPFRSWLRSGPLWLQSGLLRLQLLTEVMTEGLAASEQFQGERLGSRLLRSGAMNLVVDTNELPTARRFTELLKEHLEARDGSSQRSILAEPRDDASAVITFQKSDG